MQRIYVCVLVFTRGGGILIQIIQCFWRRARSSVQSMHAEQSRKCSRMCVSVFVKVCAGWFECRVGGSIPTVTTTTITINHDMPWGGEEGFINENFFHLESG